MLFPINLKINKGNIETIIQYFLLIIILIQAIIVRYFDLLAFYPYVVKYDEYVIINPVIDVLKTGNFAIMSNSQNPYPYFYYGFFLYVIEIITGIVWFIIAALLGIIKSVSELNYSEVHFYVTPPSLCIGLRIPILIMGVFNVFLVYKFCEKFLKNRWIGIFASFILISSMTHVMQSVKVLPNIPVTLFIFISIYYCFLVLEKGDTSKRSDFFNLGFITSAAIYFKINNIFIILSIIFFMLFFIRKLWAYKYLLYGFIIGGLIFMPFYLNLVRFLNEVCKIFNAFNINNLSYLQNLKQLMTNFFFNNSGLNKFSSWLAFIGIIFFIIKYKRKGFIFAIFPVSFILYMNTKVIFGRNYLSTLPFLSVIAGAFAYWLCTIPEIYFKENKYAKLSKYLIIIFFISIFSSSAYKTYKYFYDFSYKREESRITAAKWMEKNINKNSKVFIAQELQMWPDVIKHFPFKVKEDFIYKYIDNKAYFKNNFDYVITSNKYNYQYLIKYHKLGDKDIGNKVNDMFQGFPIFYNHECWEVVPVTPFFMPSIIIYDMNKKL